MTQFAVLHLRLPDNITSADLAQREAAFSAQSFGRVEDALAQGFYHSAALVEAPVIDEVFPLTNHIDHDWTENEGVRVLTDRPRSTSVGDIAVDLSTGQAYSCAQIGWKPIARTQLIDALVAEALAVAGS